MALVLSALATTAIGVGLGAALMRYMTRKKIDAATEKNISKIVARVDIDSTNHDDGEDFLPYPDNFADALSSKSILCRYNQDLARFLMVLCENVTRTNSPDLGEMPIPSSFEITPVQFSAGSTNYAYLLHDTESTVTFLVWSGTSTEEMWHSKCRPVSIDKKIVETYAFDESEDIRVHEGFQEIYSRFRDDIIKHYEDRYARRSSLLVIAGHSLGGALASLSALDFVHNGITQIPILIYTFASPRVGNVHFADFFENMSTTAGDMSDEKVDLDEYTLNVYFDHYRIFNTEDVVTSLPPSGPLVAYTHVGIPIAFTSNLGNVVSNHVRAYLECMPES